MERHEESHIEPAERGTEGGAEAPEGGRVETPEPEEVPELLGERSDYPIPRGGREG